jgi:hypothetical protein
MLGTEEQAKQEIGMKQVASRGSRWLIMLHAGFLLGLFLDSEDGSNMSL